MLLQLLQYGRRSWWWVLSSWIKNYELSSSMHIIDLLRVLMINYRLPSISETSVELSGLFHGYTNMVFSFLYHLWRAVWSSASPWWGEHKFFNASFVILCISWPCIVASRVICSFLSIQIRTLGMLRGRFHTLPSAFNASLIPHSTKDEKRRKQRGFFPFNLGRVRGFWNRSHVYAEVLDCILSYNLDYIWVSRKEVHFFPRGLMDRRIAWPSLSWSGTKS